MKRKLVIVLICLVSVTAIRSQGYTFSASTEPFVPLEDATDLTEGQSWNTLLFKMPLDFGFEFYGEVFDTLYIRSYVHFDPADNYFINPYGVLFADRGNSPVLYKIEGNVGARIIMIEWRNMGFWAEDYLAGTLEDYVNVQMWLYEGTNNVMIKLGPNSVLNPDTSFYGETGPAIGVYHIKQPSPEFMIESMSLDGNPSDPDVVYNDLQLNTFLNGTPADSMVYRFAYISGGINEHQFVTLSAFPNPVKSMLTIDPGDVFNGNATMTVFSPVGKIISRSLFPDARQQIQLDVSRLPGGYYLLVISDEKKLARAKFLKH